MSLVVYNASSISQQLLGNRKPFHSKYIHDFKIYTDFRKLKTGEERQGARFEWFLKASSGPSSSRSHLSPCVSSSQRMLSLV